MASSEEEIPRTEPCLRYEFEVVSNSLVRGRKNYVIRRIPLSHSSQPSSQGSSNVISLTSGSSTDEDMDEGSAQGRSGKPGKKKKKKKKKVLADKLRETDISNLLKDDDDEDTGEGMVEDEEECGSGASGGRHCPPRCGAEGKAVMAGGPATPSRAGKKTKEVSFSPVEASAEDKRKEGEVAAGDLQYRLLKSKRDAWLANLNSQVGREFASFACAKKWRCVEAGPGFPTGQIPLEEKVARFLGSMRMHAHDDDDDGHGRVRPKGAQWAVEMQSGWERGVSSPIRMRLYRSDSESSLDQNVQGNRPAASGRRHRAAYKLDDPSSLGFRPWSPCRVSNIDQESSDSPDDTASPQQSLRKAHRSLAYRQSPGDSPVRKIRRLPVVPPLDKTVGAAWAHAECGSSGLDAMVAPREGRCGMPGTMDASRRGAGAAASAAAKEKAGGGGRGECASSLGKRPHADDSDSTSSVLSRVMSVEGGVEVTPRKEKARGKRPGFLRKRPRVGYIEYSEDTEDSDSLLSRMVRSAESDGKVTPRKAVQAAEDSHLSQRPSSKATPLSAGSKSPMRIRPAGEGEGVPSSVTHRSRSAADSGEDSVLDSMDIDVEMICSQRSKLRTSASSFKEKSGGERPRSLRKRPRVSYTVDSEGSEGSYSAPSRVLRSTEGGGDVTPQKEDAGGERPGSLRKRPCVAYVEDSEGSEGSDSLFSRPLRSAEGGSKVSPRKAVQAAEDSHLSQRPSSKATPLSAGSKSPMRIRPAGEGEGVPSSVTHRSRSAADSGEDSVLDSMDIDVEMICSQRSKLRTSASSSKAGGERPFSLRKRPRVSYTEDSEGSYSAPSRVLRSTEGGGDVSPQKEDAGGEHPGSLRKRPCVAYVEDSEGSEGSDSLFSRPLRSAEGGGKVSPRKAVQAAEDSHLSQRPSSKATPLSAGSKSPMRIRPALEGEGVPSSVTHRSRSAADSGEDSVLDSMDIDVEMICSQRSKLRTSASSSKAGGERPFSLRKRPRVSYTEDSEGSYSTPSRVLRSTEGGGDVTPQKEDAGGEHPGSLRKRPCVAYVEDSEGSEGSDSLFSRPLRSAEGGGKVSPRKAVQVAEDSHLSQRPSSKATPLSAGSKTPMRIRPAGEGEGVPSSVTHRSRSAADSGEDSVLDSMDIDVEMICSQRSKLRTSASSSKEKSGGERPRSLRKLPRVSYTVDSEGSYSAPSRVLRSTEGGGDVTPQKENAGGEHPGSLRKRPCVAYVEDSEGSEGSDSLFSRPLRSAEGGGKVSPRKAVQAAEDSHLSQRPSSKATPLSAGSKSPMRIRPALEGEGVPSSVTHRSRSAADSGEDSVLDSMDIDVEMICSQRSKLRTPASSFKEKSGGERPRSLRKRPRVSYTVVSEGSEGSYSAPSRALRSAEGGGKVSPQKAGRSDNYASSVCSSQLRVVVEDIAKTNLRYLHPEIWDRLRNGKGEGRSKHSPCRAPAVHTVQELAARRCRDEDEESASQESGSHCNSDVVVSVRRSARKRKPVMYNSDEWEHTSSMLPKNMRPWAGDDDGTPGTPKRSSSRRSRLVMDDRSPVTPQRRTLSSVMATPRNKAMCTPGGGASTPSMLTCRERAATPKTPLQEAMCRLHVSAVPKALPCRENEFDSIYRFVAGKILDQAGGCIYISGVPGTGKTATVHEVIQSLNRAVLKDELPEFQFVEVNAMRLTEPRQAYVRIVKELCDEKVTAEQAQKILERRFTHSSKKKGKPTVLLVDELDVLWTRRQDVVYNLLDWPTKYGSQLIVLTIANTMDLPERLLVGRVTSRLGLTRLTFHPYTHKQLLEIVKSRLRGLNAFDSDAIQLVARKVASVTGDARRALDICRRATEIAERDGPSLVKIEHVDVALSEMISSSKVQALWALSTLELMFLQAVAAEVERTGIEETRFFKVYKLMVALCTLEGLKVPSPSHATRLCHSLSSSHLILTDHSRNDSQQRILLNMSTDDLHYVIKEISQEMQGNGLHRSPLAAPSPR